jgi:hypothetical protein
MLIYFILFAVFIKEYYRYFYYEDYEIIVNKINNQINDLKPIVEQKLITLGYNIVYCYSSCQIYLNRFKDTTKPYVSLLITFLKNTNIINEPPPQKFVSLYKDGKELETFIYYGNKLDESKYMNEKQYDLLIISDKNYETSCVNKIHYTCMPLTPDYNQSKLKFMSMEITHNDKTHKIYLKTGTYNHYIVNNVLNQNFFKYYLINILNIEINNDNFDYKISIIDYNVNIFELTENHYIIIKENDYEIKQIDAKNDDKGDESDKSDDYVKLD